jgi:uroporphyrin-3 C-methyltransferase
MNSETSDPQTEEVPAEPARQQAKRPRRLIWILFLLAAAIIAAAAWLSGFVPGIPAWKRSAPGLAIDQRVTQLEGGLAAVQGDYRDLRRSVDGIAADVGEAGRDIDALLRERRDSNLDWALAEIEFLLTVAVERLALEQDATRALAAMEAAETRLAGLAHPALAPVRRQLVADINALRSVPQVDISGLSLFLADAVSRAGTLPLNSGIGAARGELQPDPGEPQPAWRRILQSMWQELRQLIVVRRADGDAAFLLPEERWFLVHNLRLQMETARLAVLRRDSAVLRVSIGLAIEWLDKYFDGADSGVANVRDSLQRMTRLELAPALPDISSSLETVRAVSRELSREH